jgi:hypothetical protein
MKTLKQYINEHFDSVDMNIIGLEYLLQQYINERLILSKHAKQEITWDLFIEALLKHNEGTVELDKSNIEIIVSPPDDLSSTILGKLKGCQITRIHALKHRDNKYYISLSIDSGFQSGLTITDIDDLRDVLGDEQIEKIYFTVL